MKPICTVLLITYNHVNYIEKATNSVLQQKIPVFDVDGLDVLMDWRI